MSLKVTAQKVVSTALSSAFVIASTLAIPASALAQTSDTSVVNSGDNATINSTTSNTTSVVVTNQNTAAISQSFNSVANTGNNTANGNIGGGTSLTTGPAISTVTMQAMANENTTGISGGGPSNGINMLDIVNTGDDANITSTLNNTANVVVTNANSANLSQAMNSVANTGGNQANENIGNGGVIGITTGGVSNTGAFGVDVNKNNTAVSFGYLNGGLGSGTLVTNTGDNANVNTASTAVNNLAVTNVNSAAISQLMNVVSNTGDNTANENIGGVMMTTGPATAMGQFLAHANSNMTGISGPQSGAGVNMSDLVNTGDNFNSTSTLTSVQTEVVANTNSLSDTSVFTQVTNTGTNDTSDNVSPVLVHTGGAGAGAALASGGNHNTTVFGSVADVLTLWLLGSL